MKPTYAHPGRVLTIMCAGMFLVLLDVTIVNVALPAISAHLRTGVSTLQWVVDGYAVAIASLLLASGAAGDRLGHRRVLLAGFVLFGMASLLCALAPSSGVLIGARVVQGVGAALLLPSTMAVIAEAYPDRREQARALGTWAAVSSLALPLGPLLGGVLTATLGWRFVFWINVPLTLVAVLATLMVVSPVPGRQSGRFDWAGLIGFVVGLAGLVFTIISAGHGASMSELVCAAAVTTLALAGAGRAEARAAEPILPLDLLRRRAFLCPNLVALTMNLVFNGLLFVSMLYLQDVQHYSPAAAGALVFPIAVPLVVLAPISGKLTSNYGPRLPILFGCVLAAVGALGLTGLGTTDTTGWLIGSFILLGCGAGLITAAVVAAVIRATPAARSGLATGMSNTARQIGTASGVAIFGAIAGSPHATGFLDAVHTLAILAAVLWVVALGITMFGVTTTRSAQQKRDDDDSTVFA
ncbi:MFS transporter [Skermania sp. ID1734]|uniref:MFS transporter n=1 Tax=Skermania sp. ID1734 TaxID=2597516 RepID=UPI00117EE02E|nr:MFS transporter [Skermania sp. ID1734]TSD96611.1 MFS transporter [Skermania sp. ID1734]